MQALGNLKRYVRRKILGYDVATYYFAHAGEDAILQSLFSKKLARREKGFYVDVGAYHPVVSSNTYFFYINGWSGINIDPCPGSITDFKKVRPRDINLEIGISDKEETLPFYYIGERSSMNSFSKDFLQELGMYNHVVKEIPVNVMPLRKVLEKYSDGFTGVDILSIDVEGFDLQVIQSNDWEKYRPKVVVIELTSHDIDDLKENPTAKYLRNLGYEIVAKNVVLKNVASVFFADKNLEY